MTVHLRSGYPVFLDPVDAGVRRQEAEATARWLRGEATIKNPAFPQPATEDVVLLGDFNAQLNDPNGSLDPFHEALSDWTWENPAPDVGRRATAIDDGYIIDFIAMAPSLAEGIASPPAIYAFDHDPRLGGPARFHHGIDGSGTLKDYGVSDHRPVYVDVAY